jgi:hypothetical protein
MSPLRPLDLVALLEQAATHVTLAAGRQPWQRGWFLEDYRHSSAAALAGPAGPVTIGDEGIPPYEQAVERLLKEPAVQQRWSCEQVWGIVADLVVNASMGHAGAVLAAGLAALRDAPATLVVLPVSNVLWRRAPLPFDDAVLGCADSRLVDAIEARTAGRVGLQSGQLGPSTSHLEDSAEPPVLFAAWCEGQAELAVSQARRRLGGVLDLSLLLEPDPAALGLHSLRGSANRPGVRGVDLHRPALEACLARSGRADELAAQVMLVDGSGAHELTHWYNTDPLPLDRLLEADERIETVSSCLTRGTAAARRLSVAARWYAKAHWAEELDDAVLALGIALDALVGSRSALPGRAMRERFALLEPKRTSRPSRARWFNEVYRVRSAIAHGGRSSSLDASFVRNAAAEVVWAAYRILALERAFEPGSEAEFDEVFESLRWGTRSWI